MVISVSVTLLYILSHVYRLNNWFEEKNVIFKKEQETLLTEQHRKVIHHSLNQINTTARSTSAFVETETPKATYHVISTKHQLENHDAHPEQKSTKFTIFKQKPDDLSSDYAVRSSTDVNTKIRSELEEFTKDNEVVNSPTLSDFYASSLVSTFPMKNNTIEGVYDEEGESESGDSRVTTIDRSVEKSNYPKDNKKIIEEMTNHFNSTSIIDPTKLSTTPTLYVQSNEVKQNDSDTLRVETLFKKNVERTIVDDCLKNEQINTQKPRYDSKCNLFSSRIDTCAESAKYYNSDSIKNQKTCSQQKHSLLCKFVDSYRTDTISKLNLKCNYSMCHKNQVRVGILNATSGKISYMFLNSLKTIVKTLDQETQYDAKDHGADFIFLGCKSSKNNKEIFQILPFPPLILKNEREQKETKDVTERINVNVVVLDSLSREHFYRILKKTANALRGINMNTSNENIVLDFKGFQSLAPFTYVNLQALLTGSVDFESVHSRIYNFEDLFSVFQSSGYQTLLQEDTCWFDEWGSILTGNRKLKKQDPDYHKKIWNEIRNLTEHHGIDSFGLTHMSCDVLANFGVSNLFNSDTLVCLNGEPLSSYFLDHVLDNILTRTFTSNSKPLLSYTHINIAHESTGTRVITLDKHLEHFISTLGLTSNTITLLLSDHGGKTSDYFMQTLAGRFEVYDPLLFMIVPKHLKEVVGERNIQNLIDNQNSLIDMIDVRSMLLTFNKILNDPKEAENHHLLTESIKKRVDCQHISTRNYALCKCISNVTFPSAKDEKYKEFMIWLGEFAVGYLNNKLSEQQLISKSGHQCLRINANNGEETITNVIERWSSKGITYSFDISMKHNDNVDLFNFQILFNKNRNEKYELLQLEHWMRVSIYNRYASCKDRNVSHEICMCSNNKREKIDKKYISNYRQFESDTDSIALLNRTCAFLLKRINKNIVTFELANTCEKNLRIEFSTMVKFSWIASQSLPLEMTVKPHAIQFLITFLKVVDSSEDIKPSIVIKTEKN